MDVNQTDSVVCFRHIACPLCQSDEFRVDRSTGRFTFGRCGECNLAYVNPMPVLDHPSIEGSRSTVTDSHYNAMMLTDWEAQAAQARQMAPRRLEAYARLLGRPVESVIEIGCGSGAWGAAYQGKGIRYLGLDINGEMIDFARSKGLQVEQADITAWAPAAPPRADVVFASQVMEHCLSPHDFLSGISRALRQDGLVHLDVPHNRGLIPSAKRMLRTPKSEYGFLQPYHHCIAYDKTTIRQLMERHGRFETLIINTCSVLHPVWGKADARSGNLSLIARVAFSISGWMGGSVLVLLARRSQ